MYRRFIAVAVVVLCFASASFGQDEAKFKDLPNFHRVNEQLYRGAQPKRGGFQRLVQLGVKTVVNLRDDDENARAEEAEARTAGLRYFNVPMGRLGRPSDEKVERALAIINAPEHQPVFVHCMRGADRTGTIIAVYRITRDGWTSERAKAEAKRYGMGFWQVAMKDYIRDYHRRLLRRAGAALRTRQLTNPALPNQAISVA